MFKVLKTTRGEVFSTSTALSQPLSVSHKVQIGKFKMLYFQSNIHYRTENLQNDFFLGQHQPSVEKNSEDLNNIEFKIL